MPNQPVVGVGPVLLRDQGAQAGLYFIWALPLRQAHAVCYPEHMGVYRDSREVKSIGQHHICSLTPYTGQRHQCLPGVGDNAMKIR